jgi:CO/xanthine dehydrogenase FAD-binding subunit
MMRSDIEYVRPDTLDEALDLLQSHAEETAVVAGGTDVMVDLRSGTLRIRCLLDISRFSELKGIELTGDELRVGAGVTLSEIYVSRTLARFAPSLQRSAFNFASKQIRNVATIGGNVAHCSPCGDTVPPLIIHETKVVLRSAKGERTIPIETLATGPYVGSIAPDEIITHFLLKPKEGVFSDFQKIGRRQELAIARTSIAVMAAKDAAGKIAFVRLALGSSTPTPRRMAAVEGFLSGKRPSETLFWEAGKLLASKMIELSGRRPSTVYKEKAVQGLLVRVLYPMVENGKTL